MDFKAALRKEIDNAINNLNNPLELSKLITAGITKTEQWKESDSIFLFLSFRNEYDTSGLIKSSLSAGKKIYAPLIKGKKMTFHRIDNIPSSALIKNNYGILEPPENIPEEIPGNSSLMIVPGVSFTKEGYRMGRGGGFYDRYLAKHGNFVKIGVGFEVQIRDELPLDPWDQKIDMVITETNIYKDEKNGTY